MKMTKTQWKEILEELKTIRSTNKFRTTDVFYCEGYKCPTKEVRKVNVDEMYIRFEGRDYLAHDCVLNVTPNTVRARFSIKINPLYVESIIYNNRR